MTREFSNEHPKVLPACNFLSQDYFYNIFLQKSCRFSLQTPTGRPQYSWEHKYINKELIIIHVVRFLCCCSYVRGSTAVVYRAGLCASESELCKIFSKKNVFLSLTKFKRIGQNNIFIMSIPDCNFSVFKFFSDSYNTILTREAAFSRNDLNTLHEIALNSFLLRLFATKIETNESWIMCEYAHLLESWEETISKQNLSSFCTVFVGIFFHRTCGPLPWQIHATNQIKTSSQITQASDQTNLCYTPSAWSYLDGTKLRCCHNILQQPLLKSCPCTKAQKRTCPSWQLNQWIVAEILSGILCGKDYICVNIGQNAVQKNVHLY